MWITGVYFFRMNSLDSFFFCSLVSLKRRWYAMKTSTVVTNGVVIKAWLGKFGLKSPCAIEEGQEEIYCSIFSSFLRKGKLFRVSCGKLTQLCCALVAARYFLLVFPGEQWCCLGHISGQTCLLLRLWQWRDSVPLRFLKCFFQAGFTLGLEIGQEALHEAKY